MGTGVFLLRLRALEAGRSQGQAWILVGFLPVAPLGMLRITEKLPEDGLAASLTTAHEEDRRPLAARDVAAGYARGVAGLAFVLACMLLSALSAGESSWLAGLGVLLGGALPLALLGWLDQTVPRRRVRRETGQKSVAGGP